MKNIRNKKTSKGQSAEICFTPRTSTGLLDGLHHKHHAWNRSSYSTGVLWIWPWTPWVLLPLSSCVKCHNTEHELWFSEQLPKRARWWTCRKVQWSHWLTWWNWPTGKRGWETANMSNILFLSQKAELDTSYMTEQMAVSLHGDVDGFIIHQRKRLSLFLILLPFLLLLFSWNYIS